MFKKLLRFCFFTGLLAIIISISGYMAAKTYFTHAATQKAASIIRTANDKGTKTPDQELIEITRVVFDRFKEKWPSEVPLLRIRPYISNHRLPKPIKYPEGVIETNIETGMCDNAARMLHFILKEKGYDSVQWNMVTDNYAHSALLVFMPDNRQVLLDPFYGYVGYDKEKQKLLSPEEIRTALLDGKELDDILLPLSNKTRSEFYKDYKSVRMAQLGEDLNITATLPRAENQPLFLGEVDGSGDDVRGAASRYNMTPFWHYAGHKYDRSWVRTLKAQQDIRLEMILASKVEDGVITAEPWPEINGNKMIWDLKSGDQIKFYDGRAKISWRRLNSYIEVDQIAIYPN